VEEGQTAEEEWTNLETILKTTAEETIGIVKKKSRMHGRIKSVNK
jgi:hypothetical protein